MSIYPISHVVDITTCAVVKLVDINDFMLVSVYFIMLLSLLLMLILIASLVLLCSVGSVFIPSNIIYHVSILPIYIIINPNIATVYLMLCSYLNFAFMAVAWFWPPVAD